MAHRILIFSIAMGRLFILCENPLLLVLLHFWVYYFSLSQFAPPTLDYLGCDWLIDWLFLFIYISDQPQCHSGLPQHFQEVSRGDPYFLPFVTSAMNVGLYLTSASSTKCYVDLIMKHLRKFKSKRNIISHLVPKTEIASKNVIQILFFYQ